MIHHISAEHLTVDRVREILENNIKIDLSEDAKKRIVLCREYLDNKMETQKEPIYGITTGFGSLCNISIDKDQLSQLQKNLVMSHACGTGERVPAEIVKLMLLLKIQSLSYGNSGVQLETVQRLVDFFNNDVLPVVFQQGSLGASGDLAPLANMCLPLLGLGEVEYKGARRPSDEVLKEFGWKPISLQSKEGLALLNGTQFMSAFGVYSLIKARRLSEWADLIGAMSLDAFDGRINPFIDEVHEIRAHKGQLTTARNFRRLLEGSEMIARPKKHVQDPYSVRCIPGYCCCGVGQHLRASYLQADFGCTRAALVPGGQAGSEQRFHDSAVRGRFDREPEQGSLLARFVRLDSFVAGSGGPRQHGFQRCHEALPCGAEHRACAGYRAAQCGTGPRVPPSAAFFEAHRGSAGSLP